jgi:uncharacterized protein (TIGR03437 family)
MAPGQITTLFITGARTIFPSGMPVQRAAVAPLPVTLAGFSVSISQQPGNKTESMPILSVQQVNNCSSRAASPDCVVTAITAQVPSDLVVENPLASSAVTTVTTATIIEDGEAGKPFNVTLLPQNFHILSTCDPNMPDPPLALFPTECANLVTHADGTQVSPQNPARAGEVLVMYAFGLGATTPLVPAGSVSPTPAATANGHFTITSAYSSGPPPTSQSNAYNRPNPLFVGLTPGQAGLYQVNFVVEPPGGPTAGCDGPTQANLTVTLSSDVSPSTGSARICVDTASQ